MAVEATTDEHEAALRLLGALPPLRGAVATADAASPHADFAAEVPGKQGEYTLDAEANPPGLPDDLAAAFATAEGGDFPPVRQAEWDRDAEVAPTRGAGHGRVEARTLATSTWLDEYRADWPGLSQAFRLTRERTARGVTTAEVVYGLASPARSEATAEDLLDFTRAHGGIESGLHSVRDATFGEASAGCGGASRRGGWRRCGTRRSTCCVGRTTPAWWRRPADWPRSPTRPSQ